MEQVSKKIDLSKRKFIDLFKHLSEDQRAAFRKYLELRPFDLNQYDISFFELLKKYHPHFEGIPEKELIGCFPNQNYKQSIRWSCGRLVKAFHHWGMQEELLQDSMLQDHLLVKTYSKYASPDLFQKLLGKTKAVFEAKQQVSIVALKHQLFLQQQLFHHPNTDRFKSENGLSQFSKLQDDVYMAQKLQMICLQASQKKILEDQTTILFQEEVIQYAKANKQQPYFRIYLDLLELFRQESPDLLTRLKSELPNTLQVFNRQEAIIYLNLLMNYVVHLINQGDLAYRLVQFELYQIAKKHNLILINNQVTPNIFHNIIRTACLIGDLKAAQSFLHDLKEYLRPAVKDKAVHLAQSSLFFYQDKFQETIDEIFNISIQHPTEKLIIKPLLIRSFCELILLDKGERYHKLLKDNLKKFKIFIETNAALPPIKQLTYLHFVEGIRMLMKIKNTKARITKLKKVAAFKQKLELTTYTIICRDWFLKKLVPFEKT